MLSVEERLEKYFALTAEARKKVKIIAENEKAKGFLRMCDDYVSDSKHFKEQGDLAMALAAISYAHAWLDAGVRAGWFDVGNDDRLFTLPK